MTLQTFLFIRFIRSLAKQVLSLCLRWFLEDARPPLSTHNRGLKTSFMSPPNNLDCSLWCRKSGQIAGSRECLPQFLLFASFPSSCGPPLCGLWEKRRDLWRVGSLLKSMPDLLHWRILPQARRMSDDETKFHRQLV